MLETSTSGVLALRRGSTYRSVRLASLLAVALMDGLFEHPEALGPSAPFWKIATVFCVYPSFSAVCEYDRSPLAHFTRV
jgi:hypothetical protein